MLAVPLLLLVALAPPLSLVPTAASPPVLDGHLAGPFWQRAAQLGPFVTADGQSLPTAATSARLARTADALWLGFDCAEPRMDQLAAAHTERDSDVWLDDAVEVFVQRSGRPYCHFVTNPLGARFDEQGRDRRWNADWSAAAVREADRWQVVLVLPWAALGGPPVAGETWRVNLCRSRRAESETSCWSPTGGGFHEPDRFGELRFADGPWVTQLAWSLTARRRGRTELTWLPNADGVSLTVDDRPSDGTWPVAAEGRVPVTLEASWHGQPVLRAMTVVEVAAIDAPLAAARQRLATVPDTPAVHEARTRLSARLAALAAEAEQAPPTLAAELAREAAGLATAASRLRVRASAPPGAIAYGVETSLRKLLREAPFDGAAGGPLRFDAARREMDARQLVVFAGEAPLIELSAVLAEARTDDGRVLPAEAFRVRRVGYVPTVKPSYAVEHVGLWPDPLVPSAGGDVAPEGFESLWVDVRVPAGTAPGLYRGKLTLRARNAAPTEVPVEVRVRSFTLPERPSLRTAFGLGTPQWRVPQDPDAYVRNLLEHRISPYGVAQPTLVQPPASDWRSAERLELTLTADRPGKLGLLVVAAGGASHTLGPRDVPAGASVATFDLAPVRGLVQSWRLSLLGPTRATATVRLVGANGSRVLADNAPVTATLGEDGWLTAWPTWEGGGWQQPDVPAKWDWTKFDAGMERWLPLGLTGHVASLGQPLGPVAREWERHLSERGWLPLVYTYLSDEPEPAAYPALNATLGEVKRAAPGLMNMMTARAFPPELPYVDIWCPEAYSFDPAGAKTEQAKGRAVWWYVAFSTRHPCPDVWIDYPVLDCRVWPWMTWKHDLDGMLYWSVDYWSRNDPWRSGDSYPGANGDGSLLYPGDDGRPVDSLRWECLRDGLEDYEVFCLLEAGVNELAAAGRDAGLVAEARPLLAIDDGVVRSYRDYNPDPAALLTARQRMSDVLERIVAALGHEPRIEGRPRHRPGVDPAKLPATATAAAERVAPAWAMPPAQPEPGLVLRYALDDDAPLAADLSGRANHGLIRGCRRGEGAVGRGLSFGEGSAVVLPGGEALLGPQPAQGTLALWARPDFDPASLATDLWNGYATLVYLMQTDGNGLPDGYDELGLYLHGPQLLARCGSQDCLFATLPAPLRRGVWTHLALAWSPERRAVYVDGQLAAEKRGAYAPPKLDAFAGTLGVHAASRRWPWHGQLDELRIYDRCLTGPELAALAHR